MGVGVVAAGGHVGEAAFEGDFFGVGVALAGLGDAAEDADALAVRSTTGRRGRRWRGGDAVAVLGVHAVGQRSGGSTTWESEEIISFLDMASSPFTMIQPMLRFERNCTAMGKGLQSPDGLILHNLWGDGELDVREGW